MIRAIEKMLRPLYRRIKLTVSRGIITNVDESKKWRELQVVLLDGETLDGVEHAEPYGLTSRPFKKAEVIALSPGGRRANTLIIMAGDRRYRLTSLAEGEVALYDDQGQHIHIKRDGIEISGSKVDIIGDLTVTGDITSTGDVSDSTRSMQEMVDEHNVHAHTGNLGNPTSTPTTPMT